MPTYVDRLIADTQHLSDAEFGSYWLLCLAYWRNRGPLPANDEALRRLSRCESRAAWKTRRAVLEPFFEITADCWSHRFLDRELETARAVSMAASESVRTRYERTADEARTVHEQSTDGVPEQQTTAVVSSFAIAQEETAVAFPTCLESEAFRAAWSEWLAYRREGKLGKWKPRTVKAKLSEMAGWGEAVAIEAIRLSIANGWSGIFEPKTGGGGQRNGSQMRPANVSPGTIKSRIGTAHTWPRSVPVAEPAALPEVKP